MKSVILTDLRVQELYGSWFPYPSIAIPPGEGSKTRETKEKLEDVLLEAGFGRDTRIFAVGGGVVLDVAGFLAATFCRGVELVLVPTTLLAMCDAAIGGKNGVNTPLGKNQIGALYHPTRVVFEPLFLKTLPKEEMRWGLVELLKHGLIGNPSILHSLSLADAIEVKRRIVAQDPGEKGLRRVLNLGHTIGHALEALSHYQMPHGEAVTLGIAKECRLSYELGILEVAAWQTVQRFFPEKPLPFGAEEILEAMRRDKKGRGGEVRFVLLKKLGEVEECGGEYCKSVDEGILRRILA